MQNSTSVTSPRENLHQFHRRLRANKLLSVPRNSPVNLPASGGKQPPGKLGRQGKRLAELQATMASNALDATFEITFEEKEDEDPPVLTDGDKKYKLERAKLALHEDAVDMYWSTFYTKVTHAEKESAGLGVLMWTEQVMANVTASQKLLCLQTIRETAAELKQSKGNTHCAYLSTVSSLR